MILCVNYWLITIIRGRLCLNVFVNGFFQLLIDKIVEKMVLIAIIGLLDQKLLSKNPPKTKKNTKTDGISPNRPPGQNYGRGTNYP